MGPFINYFSVKILLLAGFAVLFQIVAPLWAGPAALCQYPCGKSLRCIIERTHCLLRQKKNRAALTLLKKAAKKFKGSETFTLLLAHTYLTLKNRFWALNTLNAFIQQRPGACESISWLIWLMLQEGDIKGAELLQRSRASCDKSEPPLQSRFLLLSDFIGHLKAKKKSFQGKWEKIQRLFEEDLALYRLLRRNLQRAYLPPFTLKLESAFGYTTNALSASPTDPVNSGKNSASPFGMLDIVLAFHLPLSKYVAPHIEGGFKGYYFTGEDAREYSYFNTYIKTGLILMPQTLPRFTLSYRGDLLVTAMDDIYGQGPHIYFEGHTGVVEAEINSYLTLFAEAGKRYFREIKRTRFEFDAGIGGGFNILKNLSMLSAVTTRVFRATIAPFNLYGATGLISFRYLVYKDILLRLLAMVSYDHYPNSRDYFTEGDIRKDVYIKASVGIFSPSLRNVRIGVMYEFSQKFSTSRFYEFIDHRVFAKLTYSFGFDPFEPKKVKGPGHIPLDYGLGRQASEELKENIQDLLRQEESIKRGSSCKD